jgi:hypothetical protein
MKQFFTEENNRFSMKRLCGFIATITLCGKLIHTPTEALVYAVGGLAMASLGLTAAEKIFKKYEDKPTPDTCGTDKERIG